MVSWLGEQREESNLMSATRKLKKWLTCWGNFPDRFGSQWSVLMIFNENVLLTNIKSEYCITLERWDRRKLLSDIGLLKRASWAVRHRADTVKSCILDWDFAHPQTCFSAFCPSDCPNLVHQFIGRHLILSTALRELKVDTLARQPLVDLAVRIEPVVNTTTLLLI